MAKQNIAGSLRAASLITKYLKGQLTKTERTELNNWLKASDQNRKLFYELCNAGELEYQIERFGISDPAEGWQRTENKIAAKNSLTIHKQHWKVWWQSVAALLVLALIAWQLLVHTMNKLPLTAKSLTSKYGGDVLPGMLKAELVLSNGTVVQLNADKDSVFTENGNTVQRMQDGSLLYSKVLAGVNVPAYNTIRIPNAGEYRLLLEDGTKIWLNAATSLRYPVQFTGAERRVELLEGEAYFEIAKNKEKPFIVVADRMEIQAIGTAFDVNTYPREDSSRSTTLAEGRVKVTAGSHARLLLPGEQVRTDGTTAQVFKADMEAVTAWKNGLFIFNGTPLPEVMNQVARWYDVRIVYDPNFREQKFFTGEIKRNVPASKLLQMMELTGIADFLITGSTITIKPYTP